MAMQKACGQVEECGMKSLFVQGDVSQESDIIDMVNTVVEQFGSLDILINNAGIQKECPSHEISTKDFDNVLSVNLRGAFLCAREAIKHFLSQIVALLSMSLAFTKLFLDLFTLAIR